MSLASRLDKVDGTLPSDPQAPQRFLVVQEDAAGRWWHWDSEPATEIDPATVHPKTLLVIIGPHPDRPR